VDDANPAATKARLVPNDFTFIASPFVQYGKTAKQFRGRLALRSGIALPKSSHA
jgi:hypothetical protein